jgi:uncharacterized membrane protein YgcG
MVSPSVSPSVLEAVEAELSCPLCMRLFLEPVALPCGHTIDRACLRRALALKPECPLCRSPCFVQVDDAARNLALGAVAAALFPAEAAERRAEHAREEEEVASQRIGFFLVPGTSLRLLPGMPVELVVFEPRYLLLVTRCLEASAMFAVTSQPDERLGAAVRIEAARRLANGRMHVSGVVRSRFRCLEEPAVEVGTQGLYYAQVRFFEDEPPGSGGGGGGGGGGNSAGSGASAVPLDAEALEAAAPEAAQLSRRSRAAILRPRGERALSEAQACALLRDALADLVVRACASLPHHLLQRLHSRYGQLPPPTSSPERWSHFACALVLLRPEERAACFETTRTLRRLVALYAALERLQREAHGGASGGGVGVVGVVGSSGGGGGGGGGGGEASDDADVDEDGLRPLASLAADPERLLDMLGGAEAGARSWPAALAMLLARSPVLRSLAVLAGCFALLLFLREQSGGGVAPWPT